MQLRWGLAILFATLAACSKSSVCPSLEGDAGFTRAVLPPTNDTRITYEARERMCAGRSPCSIGLRYAGKEEDAELFVADLNLGPHPSRICTLVERWLVVGGTKVERLATSCDGAELDPPLGTEDVFVARYTH